MADAEFHWLQIIIIVDTYIIEVEQCMINHPILLLLQSFEAVLQHYFQITFKKAYLPSAFRLRLKLVRLLYEYAKALGADKALHKISFASEPAQVAVKIENVGAIGQGVLGGLEIA